MEPDLPLASGGADAATTPSELARLRAENSLLRAQLNVMRQQQAVARREMESTQQRFQRTLYAVSHELRTPMTSIKTGAQLVDHRLRRLLSQPSTPPIAPALAPLLDLLAIVLRQVNLQDRLLSDLLDVSRLEHQSIEIHPQRQEFQPLVTSTVAKLQALYPDREVIVYMPPTAIMVNVDGERISQVIHNFVLNAISYAPVHLPITLRVTTDTHLARCAVCDEGPGIARDKQRHIWESFYRVPGIEMHNGSSAALGVGLYLCRALIELHSGQVGVESAPGKGSRFWCTLPLAL